MKPGVDKNHLVRLLAGVVVALLLASCGGPEEIAPSIPFAPRSDASIKDPDNPSKVFRVDMARVEELFPLKRLVRVNITPEKLKALSQEEIDQIYGRLTAGPIPDGIYVTDAFFPRGENSRERIEEIVGGLKGRAAGVAINVVESAIHAIWKGKLFNHDERIAWTLVDDLAPLRPLIDNPNTIMSSTIPRRGPLRLIFPTTKAWQLFPAKVYCGQSLLDGRRESIVIDYNYGDDIQGFRTSPDSLLGRGGLRLRDEIRMVRPGLYLGRANVGGIFLLNFTLRAESVAMQEIMPFVAGTPIDETCWTGEQIPNTALHGVPNR